jgi:hypothetical protein
MEVEAGVWALTGEAMGHLEVPDVAAMPCRLRNRFRRRTPAALVSRTQTHVSVQPQMVASHAMSHPSV